MDRRDLFKNMLGAIGGYFAFPKFLQTKNISQIKNIKNEIKLSPELDEKLKHIAEVVRRRLECKSLLRRVLMEDDLPKDLWPEEASYEKGSDAALVWEGGIKYIRDSKDVRNHVFYDYRKTDYVSVPTYNVPQTVPAWCSDCCPDIKDNLKKHKLILDSEEELNGSILESYQNKLLNLYIEDENDILFKLLDAATKTIGKYLRAKYNSSYRDGIYYLNKGFLSIEKHDLVVTNIIMNNETFRKIISSTKNKDNFDKACEPIMLSRINSSWNYLWGHLWTADIFVSNQCPKNTVYLMTSPDCVGAMPIEEDIIITPVINNNKICLYDSERIGAAIINNYAVARIDFRQ